MATKNNPGAHDCYAKAEPDEPIFVLLARDRHAPVLVAVWAALRRLEGEDPAVVDEALDCVEAMDKWRTARKGPFVSTDGTVMVADLLEKLANAK